MGIDIKQPRSECGQNHAMKDRDAAIWLLGLVDGMRMKNLSYPRKWPRELRGRFAKAWTTASQIADGGAYNPLHIVEMNKVVAELERRYFTPEAKQAHGG